MNVYRVLMDDNTVVEVYADSPEVAERDAETMTNKTAVIANHV